MNKQIFPAAVFALASFVTVTQAEETPGPLLTALSATTISGYVDVSAHWNPDDDTTLGAAKRNGFNLNSVLVSLEKPLDEGEWSAGYRADLQFGPDAVFIQRDASNGSENVRQAYVALRAPVGNGLDFKLGRWDTIIGYESSDSYKNPNYTRSFAWQLQPKVHTGLLASYQPLEILHVNAGVANTASPNVINGRSSRAESHKTYLASVALRAPEEWSVLSGATLYAGVVDGFGTISEDETSYYVGATIPTPMESLRLGVALDLIEDWAPLRVIPAVEDVQARTVALYASFQSNDQLSLHLRGEYQEIESDHALFGSFETEYYAVTATVQYDIWQNVLSRVELRWDQYGADLIRSEDNFLIAANLVYRF